MENSSLYGCEKLKEINLPTTITEFGQLVFDDCTSLTKINFNNNEYFASVGLKQGFIFKQMGIKCHNLTVTTEDYEELKLIPPQVQSLNCFYQNNTIKEIVIPTTIKNILQYSFCQCDVLSKVVIPSSVTYIAMGCFQDCRNLKQIEFNAQLTRLEKDTFYACGFESFKIPSSVKEIAPECFRSCKKLKTITIPSTVTKLEEESFFNCTSLESFIIDKHSPLSDIPYILFDNLSLQTIILPI